MSDLTLRQILEALHERNSQAWVGQAARLREANNRDVAAAITGLDRLLEGIRQAEGSITFHGDAKAILQQILAEQT